MTKQLSSLNDITPDTTPQDLFDLERAYMKTVAALPDDDRAGHFHPSANGDCGRRNVYEYIRAPRLTTSEVYARADALRNKPGALDTKTRAARDSAGGKGDKRVPDVVRERDNLDHGHAVHGLVGKRLEQIKAHYEGLGFVMSVQQELGHDPLTDFLRTVHGIGGTTDALVEITNRRGVRQRGIVETKSIKMEEFLLLRAAKEPHLNQAHIYSFRYDAPGGWIFYFGKDDADRKIYPYIFDCNRFEAVLDLYIEWKRHADANTLPDRKEDFYMCPRCQYQHLCRPPIMDVISRPSIIAEATGRGSFAAPRTLKRTSKAIPGAQLVHLRRKP